MTGYNDILVDICYRNIIFHHYYNIAGEEASTGRATDPTTKQFKLDNIQDMPLEGSRAGMLRASDCRNLIS